MIPLSQVAKEIDALERQGMTRPEAERAFWAMYRYAECAINGPESFGSFLNRLLHHRAKDGMILR